MSHKIHVPNVVAVTADQPDKVLPRAGNPAPVESGTEFVEADLRMQHLVLDFTAATDNSYGRRYEIVAGLTTPNGRKTDFLSVWQIDTGTDIPRFITMYPR